MPSIFSKIVSGGIPCFKIAESEKYLAFLDVFPLAKGHTLVIPKKETDYIFDMADEEFSGLQLFSKKVAKAIEKAVPCKRIGVAVIGLEVPHAHIHLIPMQNVSDINFSRPKLSFPKEEMEEIAQKIREQLK
jgi:histidine triad (HIT) family protein